MTPDQIADELREALRRADGVADRLAVLLQAPRVLTWGAGRTGLALRALTMRLAQLGRDAHWLADTAPPPLRPGDLFLTNASRGDLATATALLARARAVGARAVVITAAPSGPALDQADEVLTLDAQTWDGASCLPLGGQYELALWAVGDMAVDRLMRATGQEAARLAAGHVNLG